MVSRVFEYYCLGFVLIYALDTEDRETLVLSCGSFPNRRRASLSNVLGKGPMAPWHPLSEVQWRRNLKIHDAGVKAIQKVHLEADRRSEGLEDSRADAV